MSTEAFYENLEPVTDFRELARPENYQVLPEDWSVVTADVRGSTDAVRAGKYKQVNSLGVCVIAGRVNAAEPLPDSGTADFSGFECRWKEIPGRRGEILSLLVRPHPALDEKNSAEVYSRVLNEIAEIYPDPQAAHPLWLKGLSRAYDRGHLSAETIARTFGRGEAGQDKYFRSIRLANRVGRFMMKFRVTAYGIPWGNYKRQLIENANVRKFDDMFRAVLAGKPSQREQLTAWLEKERAAGKLVYGVHVSDSALMTCLVRDYAGEHYHFVDGSGGGYSRAALQMKEQFGAPGDGHG